MKETKWRKKPIAIDAFEWLPNAPVSHAPDWYYEGCRSGDLWPALDGFLEIKTLEGTMRAEPGSWIVRGVRGEIYPVRRDIFEETYEKVEDAEPLTGCQKPPKGWACTLDAEHSGPCEVVFVADDAPPLPPDAVPAPLSNTDLSRIWRKHTGGAQMGAWDFEYARSIERATVEALLEQTPGGRSLNELAAEINEVNAANGWKVVKPEEWGQEYKIPGITALIHSEVSEALEAFRKDDRENFAEELADVLIRTLDCAGGLGIDIDKVVLDKLEKNRNRGYRHGGKRV